MKTVLWDEIDFETFIEKEGGVKEIILSNPALTRYWLRKYGKYLYRRSIAKKDPEELLNWIRETIKETPEEELADTALEILAVLRMRREAQREALR